MLGQTNLSIVYALGVHIKWVSVERDSTVPILDQDTRISKPFRRADYIHTVARYLYLYIIAHDGQL